MLLLCDLTFPLGGAFLRFPALDRFFVWVASFTAFNDFLAIEDFAFTQLFALSLARTTEVLAESSNSRTSFSSLATWAITFDKSVSTRSNLLSAFLAILLVLIATYSYSWVLVVSRASLDSPYFCRTTERIFAAGSLNHAMAMPASRKIPLVSVFI